MHCLGHFQIKTKSLRPVKVIQQAIETCSYEGDKDLPVTVKGSNLLDRFQIAYTYKDLKATLNNVNDRVAGKMGITDRERAKV